MRKHFISLCRKLLALLGVGAAMNSCDLIPFGACMYGCPSADYKITGSVKDEMGNPIKGIAISQYQPAGPNADGSVIYDGWEGEAFATTAEDGTFDIFQNMFPMTGMQLMFRDVDGTENGGDFEEQSVSVEFRQVEKSNDSWYEGVFEAKKPVDVVMKLKQIPVQVDPEDGSEGEAFATTAEDGTFDIFQNMFPMTGMQLMFRDVDGTENGGDFEDQSVSVEFRQVEKSRDSWYEGVFEAKEPVDVVMKLKLIPVQVDPEDGSEGSQEASEGEKAE